MKKLLATGCLGFGLLAPLVLSAQTAQDADMQRAIQFQRNKDAADARQAAIEKRNPTVQEPGSAVPATQSADRQSADRMDMSAVSPMRVTPAFRTEPTPSELAGAVAWEHHKDTAAARQAAVEHK
jgi:hypothetical protein